MGVGGGRTPCTPPRSAPVAWTALSTLLSFCFTWKLTGFYSLYFFKLTIGECKESVKSFQTLLSLSFKYSLHAIVILLQSPMEMFVVGFFCFFLTALKCTSEVNQAHENGIT